MGLFADIKGIDLSALKDDGFRKFGVVLTAMIFVGVWTSLKLMPVSQGLTIEMEMTAAYAGYNIITKVTAMLAESKKNNGATDGK